ncbi:MAG TPA: hypothetical protein VK357_06325 [Rubrobacteraceae bacterium]|nr:hypothetical protein [Rubrobacteraceae bacterium]
MQERCGEPHRVPDEARRVEFSENGPFALYASVTPVTMLVAAYEPESSRNQSR